MHRAFIMLFFATALDCVAEGRTPFPFIQHGGFFIEPFISRHGIRDNLIAITAVAVLGGLVAMRSCLANVH